MFTALILKKKKQKTPHTLQQVLGFLPKKKKKETDSN